MSLEQRLVLVRMEVLMQRSTKEEEQRSSDWFSSSVCVRSQAWPGNALGSTLCRWRLLIRPFINPTDSAPLSSGSEAPTGFQETDKVLLDLHLQGLRRVEFSDSNFLEIFDHKRSRIWD